MRILDHPQFDLAEFSERWQKARNSALRNVLVAHGSESSNLKNLREEQLLSLVTVEMQGSVFRNVFDYSRRFGLSAVGHLGMSFEIGDLAEVLPHVGAFCFSEQWRNHNAAQVLERNGCKMLGKFGVFGCDYWREALDGLVMGVGENERLARHKSRGHGDSECVDVLFTEEYSLPRVVDSSERAVPTGRRYGLVPQAVRNELKDITEQFELMKMHLYLDGLSEGILYYRLETQEGVLCGAGGKLLHESISREVAKKLPFLTPRDAAPLAVYGGAT